MSQSNLNVLVLAVDTLRADHLGCYGYGKNTSPCIDALARESVVFDRAFAPGIPTMPSFTTLLSGLHPYRHGITAHSSEQQLSERVLLMPQIARDSGWVTAGIDSLVVQANGCGSWFARGYDFFSGFVYRPFSNQAEQLANRAIRFITDLRDRPFFLFLHLWDPHTPYGPPPPYDTMHYAPGESDVPDLAAVKALSPEYYEAFLGDMKLKRPDDYAYVVAQYDGEISYADAQIGRIVAHLKASGLWDNTLIVLLGDHGECFGEGDVYFDHHGLYDAVIRVPLMCRTPGSAPARCAAMVSTEDILATLIDVCEWTPPDDGRTGVSFAPVLRGEAMAGRGEIFGVESTRQASLCLRTDRWKLILPITLDARGAPLVNLYGQPRDPSPLLFDLANDPEERHDVAAQFPDVRDDLARRLDQWRADEVARRGGDDPVLEGLSLPYDYFMERITRRKG